MSCYHPLKGFPVGLTEYGKTKYKIVSYDITKIYVDNKNKYWYVKENDINNPMSRPPIWKECIEEFVQIPCGRCVGCRLDYSRQWADRCLLELPYHESSYFLTLTYDDEHLPSVDPIGNYYASLQKRDVQLFLKRLRKTDLVCDNFCYFSSGEYGPETIRPHYHMIAFDIVIPDLVFYRLTNLGHRLWFSESLDEVWSNGKVIVGQVSWQSIAYTARYIMKKQYGKEVDYGNASPEFSLMSLKPAIGKRYFDEHKENMKEFDAFYVSTEKGAREIRPPRYFFKLLEKEEPDLVREMMMRRREFAQNYLDLEVNATDLDMIDMLAVKERRKERQLKGLQRSCL